MKSVSDAHAPEWSPDGELITFFNGTGAAVEADIWVVNADGTGLQNVTGPNSARDLFPAWSPDGKKLTFVSDRDGTFRLYTMRSNGARVTRLVDIEIMGDAEPDWGPRP